MAAGDPQPQIVKEADLAVALFCGHLGTPTGEAELCTVEEIKVLVEAGKSVAESPRVR